MDELVFRFLLESGYPRASILSEFEFLPVSGSLGAPGEVIEEEQPDYVIVDPDTLERLAVFKAVPALDDAALGVAAEAMARSAQRLGGHMAQSFLVRIDPKAGDAGDSVLFYRSLADAPLHRVPTHAVPDLEALRTRVQLARLATMPAGTLDFPDLDEEEFDLEGIAGSETQQDVEDKPRTAVRAGVIAWLPALMLAALTAVDWLTPKPLVSAEQAILAVGTASLLVWAIQLRR